MNSTFVGDFARLLYGANGSRAVYNLDWIGQVIYTGAPRTDWVMSKARPQHRELRPLLLRSVCWFFNVPQSKYEQGLWDGTYGLSSLSEKTRKSNHLKMSE